MLEQPKDIVSFPLCKKHSDLQWLIWKELRLEAESIFRELKGSDHEVTEERVNWKKIFDYGMYGTQSYPVFLHWLNLPYNVWPCICLLCQHSLPRSGYYKKVEWRNGCYALHTFRICLNEEMQNLQVVWYFNCALERTQNGYIFPVLWWNIREWNIMIFSK